jgi:hypothetical protein
MAKQYTLIRKIGVSNVAPGGFDVKDLPRDHDYNGILLRLSGSVQVTTNCTSVRAEAPLQLLPRVQVIAEGKNMLFNAPSWYASLGNMKRRVKDSGGRAITSPSAATVATYPVEALIFIDFATLDGIKPKDSNFRAYGLSLFQVQLQYGNPIDIFVPGAGVAVFSGTPTVEIFSLNVVEERDANGKYIDSPSFIKKVSFQELSGVASNAALEARLPAGNLIRSVFVRTEGGVTAGEPSTAQLNNLILQNSNDVRLNLTAAQLRMKNNGEFGQVQSGYYVGDLVSTGVGGGNNFLGNLWDVGGASEPKAIVDITGFANAKLQVVTEEYIPAA